ncbi:MAG: aldo/keto reductase [Candidatus Glassbacteria bacterium]|nr:aldo/keto reductase [Candidatus Glassbacteria bacterium]
MVNRRCFLATGAAALGAALTSGSSELLGVNKQNFLPFPSSGLPSREFGSTGARVSLITFGGGGRWAGLQEDSALQVLTTALQRGVNCIDTAYSYGRSEEIIGKILPEWRSKVILHTKVATRDPNQWWRHLETSLNRLGADYVDTLMVHQLEGPDDLARLEVKDGPFELLHRAKEQNLCRWIGVSTHTDWKVLLEAHRRHKFDHVVMSLNVATNEYTDLGFEENALPVLAGDGVAITAMKALGVGRIVNAHPDFDYRTCIRYSLSLPGVHTVTVTMPNLQHMHDDVDTAAWFEPFGADELDALKAKAAGEVREAFREFMRTHTDLA